MGIGGASSYAALKHRYPWSSSMCEPKSRTAVVARSAFLACVFASATSPAEAGDSVDVRRDEAEEGIAQITVTAERRAADAQSVPVSVSVLTADVFGLEVTRTGFHDLLRRQAESSNGDYESIVTSFGHQLGSEGLAIARSLAHRHPTP